MKYENNVKYLVLIMLIASAVHGASRQLPPPAPSWPAEVTRPSETPPSRLQPPAPPAFLLQQQQPSVTRPVPPPPMPPEFLLQAYGLTPAQPPAPPALPFMPGELAPIAQPPAPVAVYVREGEHTLLAPFVETGALEELKLQELNKLMQEIEYHIAQRHIEDAFVNAQIAHMQALELLPISTSDEVLGVLETLDEILESIHDQTNRENKQIIDQMRAVLDQAVIDALKRRMEKIFGRSTTQKSSATQQEVEQMAETLKKERLQYQSKKGNK